MSFLVTLRTLTPRKSFLARACPGLGAAGVFVDNRGMVWTPTLPRPNDAPGRRAAFMALDGRLAGFYGEGLCPPAPELAWGVYRFATPTLNPAGRLNGFVVAADGSEGDGRVVVAPREPSQQAIPRNPSAFLAPLRLFKSQTSAMSWAQRNGRVIEP